MASKEYLLIHYAKDDTYSVLSSSSKSIIERCGDGVKVKSLKWPRQGAFDGKIIESGCHTKYSPLYTQTLSFKRRPPPLT